MSQFPQSLGAAQECAENKLAQILPQLQQGQAQIAQDSRVGLGKLASGFKKSLRHPGTVDVKGVGEPDALKGSHDEVQKVCRSWSYKFETWFWARVTIQLRLSIY